MECAGKDNTDALRLLVTPDQNYLPQLQVLPTSAAVNNPDEHVEVYLMHSGIPAEGLEKADRQCRSVRYTLFPRQGGTRFFHDAPVTKRYPQEMYYHLLAPHLLPEHLDRILYLDPDILVINPLRPLWETDLQGNLFAAAAHTGMTDIANIVNRLWLGTDSDYYNSGVLLMDLEAGRKEIVPAEIFAFSAEHRANLFLPDQDISNAMYSERVLPLDEAVWNYDARNYNRYLLRSSGKADTDWVMSNTAILHFCGRAKPRKPGYPYRFGLLYKHYARLTERGGTEVRLRFIKKKLSRLPKDIVKPPVKREA